MAKINATYGAGYHIDPNFNYSQLEEAQRKERRKKQQQGGDGAPQDVFRQTFAAPFNLICGHCNGRTARGTHQYVNRKKSGQTYMGMPIWALEFRCQHCQKHFTIVTDWATPKLTGGYICEKHCRRPDGDDFYARNLANAAATAALKAAKADEERSGTGDLDALAQHNERMERIHAVNRDIEERLRARETLASADDGSSSMSTSTFLLGDDPVADRTAGMSSLSRTLLAGIRQKRDREETQGNPSTLSCPEDEAIDDEFEAFQKMLRASTADGDMDGDADPVACLEGASSAPSSSIANDGPASLEPASIAGDADSVALLMGPAAGSDGAVLVEANPFAFDVAAPPSTVQQHAPAGVSAVLCRKNNRQQGAARSLLSKFQ